MIRKQIFFFLLLIIIIFFVIFLVTCIGNIKPTPGTSFSGSIDMGNKASSATISFKISDDGTFIENLSTSIIDLKVDGLTAGRVSDNRNTKLALIENGKFSASIPAVGAIVENYKIDKSPSEFQTVTDIDNIGQIEGKFLSLNKSSGTIKIYMWLILTDYAVEIGEFFWEAQAQDTTQTTENEKPTGTITLTIDCMGVPLGEMIIDFDSGAITGSLNYEDEISIFDFSGSIDIETNIITASGIYGESSSESISIEGVLSSDYDSAEGTITYSDGEFPWTGTAQ